MHARLSPSGVYARAYMSELPPFVLWMLGTGMNERNLAIICALLVATPSLIGCESSRDSPDRQFQKQVKRAEECRQLQDNALG